MHVYIYTTSLKGGYFATNFQLQFHTSLPHKKTCQLPPNRNRKKKSRNVGAPWRIQSQGSHLPTSDSPDPMGSIGGTGWGNYRCRDNQELLHPGRLTWTIIMEVWKIMFLSKWVICRFHVNLPGCIPVQCWWYCWWIRNPANQLRLVVHPIVIE